MAKESMAISCITNPSDKLLIKALSATEFNVSIMEGGIISNAIVASAGDMEKLIAWYKKCKLLTLLTG